MSEDFFDPTEQPKEPTPDMEAFYHQRFAEFDEQDAIREEEKPVESRDEHGNRIFTFPVASTRRLHPSDRMAPVELDQEEDELEAMLEANSNRSKKVRFTPSRLPEEPPVPKKPEKEILLTAPVEDEREKAAQLEEVLQDVLYRHRREKRRVDLTEDLSDLFPEDLSEDFPDDLPDDFPEDLTPPEPQRPVQPERPFRVAPASGPTPSQKLEQQEQEEQRQAELRQNLSARRGEEIILNIPLRRRDASGRLRKPEPRTPDEEETAQPVPQSEAPADDIPDADTPVQPDEKQPDDTSTQPADKAPAAPAEDEAPEEEPEEEIEDDEEEDDEPAPKGPIARLFSAWFEERIEEQGRQINADVEYEQEHRLEEEERAAKRPPFRFRRPFFRKKPKPAMEDVTARPDAAPPAADKTPAADNTAAKDKPPAGDKSPAQDKAAPREQSENAAPAQDAGQPDTAPAPEPASRMAPPPRRLKQSTVAIQLEPGLEEDEEEQEPEAPQPPAQSAQPAQPTQPVPPVQPVPSVQQVPPAQTAQPARTPDSAQQPAKPAAKKKPAKLTRKQKKARKKAAKAAMKARETAEGLHVVGEPVALDRQPEQAEKPAKPENVIRLPEEHKGKLEQKLDNIREHAGDFADGMFSGESAETKAEEKLHRKVAKLIPATDEERKPRQRDIAREERRKRAKEREERQHHAPDTSPKELYHIYGGSYKSQHGRLRLQLLAAVLLLLLSAVAGGELGVIQVPYLQENLRLTGLILTLGLAAACVVGLDTLLEGIIRLIRWRPALCTLSSIGALLALLDGLWYTLIGRDGPLPFCGFAALSLWAMSLGSSQKKRGLRDACEDAYTRSQYERLTMDEAKWSARGVYVKQPDNAKGFGSQIQEPDGAERVFRYAAPVMMAACAVFGVISAIGQRSAQMLIWDWSVIFVLATPLSATLAYGLPYAKQVRRLRRSGAVLAGWDGVESLRGNAGIVLTDRDLFPDGYVQVMGIQNFGDVPLEKLTGCTASMVREAELGVKRIFEDQIRIQGGFFRRVDNLDTAEEGGMAGVIRGDTVLIGTSGYLELHGIPIEPGYQVKNAVFCAINGKLQGSFALNYDLPRTVRPAIQTLLQGGISPILATRDFNITPDVLRTRFKLPADRMQYPPVDRRFDLSATGQTHNRILGALIFREGIVPFVDAILGGRRLYSVVRLNTLITLLASVVGSLLGLYLTWVHAYQSLSLMNTLFFLLMWLVPTLLISNGVDQF